MDSGNLARPETLLAAQKHARLVAKAEQGWASWGGKGKGYEGQESWALCAVGCEPLPGPLLGGLGEVHVPADRAAGGWPEGVNSFGSLGVWLAWGFLNDAFSVLGEFLGPLMGPGRSPQEWSSKHRSLLPLQVSASCKVWSLKGVDWCEVFFNAEQVQDAWYFCTSPRRRALRERLEACLKSRDFLEGRLLLF